jgi:CRP-like cAMP-binding protein
MSKTCNSYSKGQHIFREGDRVFGLFFIKEGRVKIVSSGFNNREQIARLATNGHIIGHRGYGNELYPVSAIALDETYVCFVDNSTIYELMLFYSTELRKAELRLRYLAQMTMREKIAGALLYLLDIFGEDEQDGSLNVSLSRQELADLAGTTAEQVSRELTSFEKESIIAKHSRKLILLNHEELNKILSSHNMRIAASSWAAI